MTTYSLISVDFPGSTSTRLVDINDFDKMVGSFTDSSGHSHGFLYSGGMYTTVDVGGSVFTTVGAINDSGQILGSYTDSTGHIHGFLDSGGMYTTIDVPGSTQTLVRDINDSGQIVGSNFASEKESRRNEWLTSQPPLP